MRTQSNSHSSRSWLLVEGGGGGVRLGALWEGPTLIGWASPDLLA